MMKKKKKSVKGNPWFRKRVGHRRGWSFVPINLKGWAALVLLIVVNVFAAQYFDVMNVAFVEVSKFLVVFLLSLAVFILIAKRKTESVKVGKK